MRYRLVVLTHGPDFSYLARTLDAFYANVTPAPTDAVLVVDGPYQPPLEIANGFRRVALGPAQVGFCRATAACWEEAKRPGVEYAFHLEHDFVVTRRLSLLPLARALELNPSLAQMLLLRQPVNSEEVAAGGYLRIRPESFGEITQLGVGKFVVHERFFSTNANLFPRQLAVDHEWPDGPECEGKFGIYLREHDYRFAIWGGLRDEPMTTHIGSRTGHGY